MRERRHRSGEWLWLGPQKPARARGALSSVGWRCAGRDSSPSPTWRTFLDRHVRDLVSIDFVVVPTATLKVLFVFPLLARDRRRIVHFNVTEDPTVQWTAQQFLEGFPYRYGSELFVTRR